MTYDGDDADGDVVGYIRRPTPRQVKGKSWKMNRIRITQHHTIQMVDRAATAGLMHGQRPAPTQVLHHVIATD